MDNFYGTIPRMDETKKVLTKVFNTDAFIAGVNYTDDERFWGCYELLTCWPGRVLESSTGDYTMTETTATDLVESFNRGDLTGIPRSPIGIDEEHKLYTDSNGKYVGYIVDMAVYEGDIATYTAANVRVVKEVPPKTQHVMGTIAWLESKAWAQAQAELPFPSIVFSVDPSSGKLSLGHPTRTGLPADEIPPAMVIICKKPIQMEDSMDINELINQIVELLKTKTPEEVQAILDSLSAGASMEPAAEPEAAAKSNDAVKQIQDFITNLQAKAEEKIKTETVVDEAVIAAKAELIEGGMSPELADKQAQHFAGLKAEKAVICAKSFMAKGQEISGGQTRGLKPDYPADFQEHVKTIMAKDKTLKAYQAIAMAHEERGDK